MSKAILCRDFIKWALPTLALSNFAGPGGWNDPDYILIEPLADSPDDADP